MEQFEVSLSTGEKLKGCYWPAENAAANLTIQTGMNEHASRYDDLAKWMNERGVNVWCLDAFGQGLNAESVEAQERWPEDGFAKNVEGIHLMTALAKENGLPTTHMGHSMGSFMTQSLIQRYPHFTDKVIICGSNGGQAAMMKMGYAMAKMQVNKKNWNEPNKTLSSLGLGGYTKAVKNRKTDLDWLSYDEENVKTYIADPYCGHENTNGFWLEFLKGMATIWTKKCLKTISPDERILLIAGEEDPVGRNGKGPKWLEKTYKKLGVKDVALILYPHMRHEIHNETEHLKVYEDLLTFIKK